MNRALLAAVLVMAASAGHSAEPAWGTLTVTITESPSGKTIPGKICLIHAADGKPARILSQSSETQAARPEGVWTISGKAALTVFPGRYRVLGGRGTEYSVAETAVDVPPGGSVHAKLSLVREVDTSGYVAADLHLHTIFSDGDPMIAERLISLAGEGVEFAVATDHNQVVDYGPVAAALGAGKHLLCISGDEVTTWGENGIGHFCAYPMLPGSEPVSTKPTTGRDMFAAMRKPKGRPLVQVNHPRWNGGAYFLHSGVGVLTGRAGPRFDPNFEAVEIMNDSGLFGWVENPQVREDWYNLLNRGLVFCAVANSDSHSIWYSANGMPRTYIASRSDEPEKLAVKDLLDSIVDRRCTSGLGIFLTLEVNGTPMGGRTSARFGQTKAKVRAQTPGWIRMHSVRLIVNGDTATVFDVPENGGGPTRFEREISFVLPEDSWIVAEAEGPDFDHPLYGRKVLPRAATNPVWVDVDGNGRFDLMLTSVQRAINMMKPGELWDEAGKRPSRWVKMLIGELYDRGGDKAMAFLSRAASGENPAIFDDFIGVAGKEESPAEPVLRARVAEERLLAWGTSEIVAESASPVKGDLKVEFQWSPPEGTAVEPSRRQIEAASGGTVRETFEVRWPAGSDRGPVISGSALVKGGKGLPQVENFDLRIYPVVRAASLKSAPVLDGILGEWPAESVIPRSFGERIGKVMIALCGDSLCFAADVKDGEISVPDREKLWLADVLEFFIDTSEERGGDSYRPTSHNILVHPVSGPGASPAYVVRWHHDGDLLKENVYGEKGISAVCRKTASGYALEGTIPLSLISPSGKLGKKFYLNYELRNVGTGSQHLSASREEDTNSRPSTWAAVLTE